MSLLSEEKQVWIMAYSAAMCSDSSFPATMADIALEKFKKKFPIEVTTQLSDSDYKEAKKVFNQSAWGLTYSHVIEPDHAERMQKAAKDLSKWMAEKEEKDILEWMAKFNIKALERLRDNAILAVQMKIVDENNKENNSQ